MKVGALVLYIDNAAGGFTQLIERSAKRNGLVAVAGPFKHVHYNAEALRIYRFGYVSCFQTKVTIILLQKVLNPNLNLEVLSSEPKPGKKLDFVVFENILDNNLSDQPTPLNVNVFSPKLNTTGADSKCVEKYPEKLNNLSVSPAKTNPARTFQNFPGSSSVAAHPPKSSPVSPPKTSPVSPPKTSPVSPPKTSPVSSWNSDPRPTHTPSHVTPWIPQPVSRSSSAAQRYQPVWTPENTVPPEEPVDDSEDAPCSCCVVS